MKVIKYPARKDWDEILRRPVLNVEALRETVRGVLDKVRTEGDKAVLEYEALFDKVRMDSVAVTETEMNEAEDLITPELKMALEKALHNIETFHERSEERRVGKEC